MLLSIILLPLALAGPAKRPREASPEPDLERLSLGAQRHHLVPLPPLLPELPGSARRLWAWFQPGPASCWTHPYLFDPSLQVTIVRRATSP